jgi:Arc-like DNA binding domain
MPARKPSDMIGLKLRFREELRRQIERSAKQHNVSLNNEIVRRIEESLQKERLPSSEQLAQVLLIVTRREPGLMNDPRVMELIENLEETVFQADWMSKPVDMTARQQPRTKKREQAHKEPILEIAKDKPRPSRRE